MKHGDFTRLAKMYSNRPSYNYELLHFISRSIISLPNDEFYVADIGAGTGKLTKILAKMGFKVFAVEPNDAMRKEGMNYTKNNDVVWSKGTGEKTGLNSNQFNWVTMASSFHWTNPELSLPEFHRILKPEGHLSIIWNPRDIQSSQIHKSIEKIIYQNVPNLIRKSSGIRKQTKDWKNILVKNGYFHNVIYSECSYEKIISKERYMNTWKSVNDIRVQAGEKRFKLILNQIESRISKLDNIVVPYLNTCWTAQKLH
tara:strand:- start:2019 stop:2786 length:768 start_codon:yes stop_codon:yes gene_type:complete